MAGRLEGRKTAILASSGGEEVELVEPRGIVRAVGVSGGDSQQNQTVAEAAAGAL